MYDSSGADAGMTVRSCDPADAAVRSEWQAVGKRLFDMAIACTALVFLAPAFLIIAVAIRLDTAGPIFFRQRRTGLNGKVFRIFKFRSMSVVEDGEAIRHATSNDPRVTRVGDFLRKSSLDEMPQLLNVIMGDMSLVGPRPHALSHDVHYGALLPEYSLRFAVRPGLTGLAQVKGLRGEIHQLDCMARRVTADVEYVRTWSVARDFMILLQTVPMILRRVNAY
ncbi:exopolysaccharide biosynthesis polyprenyl glycosylphosphotransferase [Rhizobium sp. CRIBSB]|nr:exopolysaccharide biosynthesis polyprenyl glycosylphosphotransferase [Rhizobium sp. CRIBSB]